MLKKKFELWLFAYTWKYFYGEQYGAALMNDASKLSDEQYTQLCADTKQYVNSWLEAHGNNAGVVELADTAGLSPVA